jgi:hypothetical protein
MVLPPGRECHRARRELYRFDQPHEELDVGYGVLCHRFAGSSMIKSGQNHIGSFVQTCSPKNPATTITTTTTPMM